MRKHIVLASLAYVAGILALTWIDLAVLCRGDPKFDAGCGGFGLYAPLGVLFVAPIFILSLAAGFTGAWSRAAGLAWAAVAGAFGAYLLLGAVGWTRAGYVGAVTVTPLVVLGIRLALDRHRGAGVIRPEG